MNEENTQRLYKKFPRIFRQKDLPLTQTLMCWGFCCGDGWYDLIESLCDNIQAHVEHHNEHYEKQYSQDSPREPINIEAVQVKEKYGGLRFYVDGCDPYVRGLISLAESMSYKICEHCGKPGRPNKKGWISTSCESCRESEAERRSERFRQSQQLQIPFDGV